MTPSQSRELAGRHEGDRAYFRRPGRLARWKYALAAAALAVSAGWASFDVLFPGRAAYSHTHGPLASPHAMWETNCNACHQEFSAAGLGPLSLLRPADRWCALSCEQCHAGPAHHARVDAEGAAFHEQCANCHHDHGGRLNSLVRLADGHCTRCHADLPAHQSPGDPRFSPRVTAFAADHPEFPGLARYPAGRPYDRRTLKFSHGLHMTPGLVYKKDAKGALSPRRLRELSGGDAAAPYLRPGQAEDSPIALECSSCHQPDARTEGAYYAPVRFDAHCKACHPLRAPAAVSGAVVLPAFAVPHRKQPKELQDLLAGEYARRLLDPRNPAVAAAMGPGGRFDLRAAPALATFRGEVGRLSRAALSALLQGAAPPGPGAGPSPSGGYACGKCHDRTGGDEPASARVAGMTTTPVWFPHARFSHLAHRGVACAGCHPGTGAAYFGEGWAAEKEPIRIAGVESCKECHGPARPAADAADAGGVRRTLGGVRHGCTDCHRYHNGDHPLQGRGAGARNPGKPLTPGEFSRGRR
jgi:hypothetical protein